MKKEKDLTINPKELEQISKAFPNCNIIVSDLHIGFINEEGKVVRATIKGKDLIKALKISDKKYGK